VVVIPHPERAVRFGGRAGQVGLICIAAETACWLRSPSVQMWMELSFKKPPMGSVICKVCLMGSANVSPILAMPERPTS
jgi:hypothetical protein